MKLVISIATAALILTGCVTRTKVVTGKTTSPRWVTVDNPKEFLSAEEQSFFQK